MFSIKYRYSVILLKKKQHTHKLHLSCLICCNHICMVSVTSASRYITPASRYQPRYQSSSSMYIRGLIPRNFAELAEAVPIDITSKDSCNLVAPINSLLRQGNSSPYEPPGGYSKVFFIRMLGHSIYCLSHINIRNIKHPKTLRLHLYPLYIYWRFQSVVFPMISTTVAG